MENYEQIEQGSQVKKVNLVLLIELGFFLGTVAIFNFYVPLWITFGEFWYNLSMYSLVHSYYVSDYCSGYNVFSDAKLCKHGFSDCNTLDILYTGNQVMLGLGYTSACLLFLGSILLIVAYCKRGIYFRFVRFLYLLPGAFYSLGMIVFLSAFGKIRENSSYFEYNFKLGSSGIFSIFLAVLMFGYGVLILLSTNKLFGGKVDLK